MGEISLEWWILYLLIVGIAAIAFLVFFAAIDAIRDDIKDKSAEIEHLLRRIAE